MKPSNFDILEPQWPDLAELGRFAESYAHSDPDSSLTKMRIFVERLVKDLYRRLRIGHEPNPRLVELIDGDEFKAVMPRAILLKLDAIRVHGNRAAHGENSKAANALVLLKELYHVACWLAISAKKVSADQLPKYSEPPSPDVAATAASTLKRQIAEQELQLSELLKRIEEEKEARQATEAEAANLKEQLEAAGQSAAKELGFNEQETRHWLVDRQLIDAGWTVGDSGTSTDEVAQEQKVLHQTTQTGEGSADYVLWNDDGKPLAVVEVKRTAEDPAKGKMQAKYYADGLQKEYGQRPVIFYTNGFEIWVWDDAQGYPSRKVYGFYSKDSLQQLVFQRTNKTPLTELSPDKAIVDRFYQIQAIKNVTEKFDSKRRKALVVQATGTGKTRVAIALADVLMRANWVKRVLFLCDRRELRKQARDAFTSHTSHSPVIVSAATAAERQHRVYLATYPAMMKIHQTFDPGFFDLIIADESHRSIYNIYRDIFDWFDSLQVGLTATPVEMVSRSTCRLFDCSFQQPDFNYTYEEAIENEPPFLVPFELYTHTTKFLREGIQGSSLTDEQIRQLEDEGVDPNTLDFDASAIDRAVYVTGTNDEVLKNLMENGVRAADGQTLGKTIIFARNHRHATLLQERFDKLYPQYGGKFCAVIDNYEPRAEALIDDFKDPKSELVIAISVDMLDTGIDVPEVVNLVFAKPVKSKVKFWQMIGRGTRLCPKLFGEGKPKTSFRIFDHWGNFEYFGTRYKPAEITEQLSLARQMFEARIRLAEQAQLEAEDEIFKAAMDLLAEDMNALPDDSIRVRDKWQELRRAKVDVANKILSPSVSSSLRNEISPLMQWRNIRGDSPAIEFDLLIAQLQFSALTGAATFVDVADEVRNKIAQLPMHLNQVKEKSQTIKETKAADFWAPDKPSFDQLEKVRKDLRGLMRFIQSDGGSQVKPQTIDVEDTDAVLNREKTRISEIDLAAYRANVLDALKVHFDSNPTLQKIRRGESVSETELTTLISLVLTQNPSVDLKTLKEFYVVAEPLEKIIRSVVGMEKEAVSDSFRDFVHEHPQLSAKQMQFLKLLQNHIAKHGGISVEQLYEKPFTTLAADGVDGVFSDALVDELIELLAKFESAPEPKPEIQE
ncbi:DEAD/DEAH box helicase family protein [Defluviimonas aestuarii]|uniref:DEAD/DEAH box helicase family protein n=1 Tax=Albidovulum aestuarii TaxID=1130726 RepID=UPI00249BC192|nr:DEAD/DEAH box helicase family protein [Defluviimonas aestuarii]MDI3337941.1 DEAD/DEAH box helicase family protein [Defluviimonas aestuarii]